MHRSRRIAFRIAAVCLGSAALSATALAQLRVSNWNVTNYSGGRVAAFETAIYGSFQGRSLAPDVLIGQEFLSAAGVNAFRNILNNAPGSPGDWASAPFINGNDTDNAFFYRTSKVTFLGVTTVLTGSGPPNPPRDVQRYDIRLVGYTSGLATIACYSSHMKAGSASADQARRLLEAQAIRADATALPADWHFLLGADMNIQDSSQAAYQELVGFQAGNNAGRFWDPIKTPGSWNNNGAFRIVHTQDPSGAGGMDDRYDQILIARTLRNGSDFDYDGNATIPYSTTAWNDANHSYRSWGNDGTSFNTTLTVAGNQMVGSTIAQAIVDSTTQGHLPVVLNLLVPAQITSDTVLDFGQVQQNDLAEQILTVTNVGDVALWTAAGIADLKYSIGTTAGFGAQAGTFSASAGVAGTQNVITMDTSTLGVMNGTLTITSDAVEEPTRLVTLLGEVISGAPCAGDVDGNNVVDLTDLAVILGNFGVSPATRAQGDLDGNGVVDLSDLAEVLGQFGNTCP